MRYLYLDYAKGFAIILMLFTHTLTGKTMLGTWAFSFHMPIFFIVCGMILAKKYPENIEAKQVRIEAKRRIIHIGIPYLIFGTLLACFYSLLNIIAGQPISFLPKMKGLLTLQGIDSLWFLPCYVLAELAAIVMRNDRVQRVRPALLMIAFTAVCILANHMPTAGWQRIIVKTTIGWIFVEMGVLMARYHIIEKIPRGGVLPAAVAGMVLSMLNGFAAIGSLELQNPVLFFFNALLSSAAVLAFCKSLEGKQIGGLALVEYFGRNTIVVVCTNNLLIEMIRLLDYKLTGSVLLNTGYVGCVVFTAILLVLEYILIRVCSGKLRVLFGKGLV